MKSRAWCVCVCPVPVAGQIKQLSIIPRWEQTHRLTEWSPYPLLLFLLSSSLKNSCLVNRESWECFYFVSPLWCWDYKSVQVQLCCISSNSLCFHPFFFAICNAFFSILLNISYQQASVWHYSIAMYRFCQGVFCYSCSTHCKLLHIYT